MKEYRMDQFRCKSIDLNDLFKFFVHGDVSHT